MPFDVERDGFDASDFEEFKFCFSSQLLWFMKVTCSKAQAMIRGEGEAAAVKCTLDGGERKIHIGHTSWFTSTGVSCATLVPVSPFTGPFGCVRAPAIAPKISSPFTGLTEERRYDHTS